MKSSERIAKAWIRKRYNLDDKGATDLVKDYAEFLAKCGVDNAFRDVPVHGQFHKDCRCDGCIAIRKLEEACK